MNRLYTIKHKKSGEIVLIEAPTAAEAFARFCEADYQISVTRAIDVGEHITNGVRVITGVTKDFSPAT